MSENLIFRRYEDKDKEEVKKLHVLALGNIYKSGPWEEDLDNIEKVYLANNGEYLVVENDKQIIAMGAFRRIGEKRAEIKRMRVHPNYWRRGIGQRILSKLELLAKEKGYQCIQLDTTIQQEPTQMLYLKNNYREIKRENKGPFDCIFYEKEI